MISSCAASPTSPGALPVWSQVLTVSGWPALGTGQALREYLLEEGLRELSRAGAGLHRGPQATTEQGRCLGGPRG